MPIYDFQCNDCGHKDEVMRRASAPNVEVCPQCGKESSAKQLSAPSFQLSGTGWYATNFKDNKSNATAANTKADTPVKDSATGTKATESIDKPAACEPGCGCH